jgi:tetratricopeptide (TPR) repeat protein
MIYLHLGAHKTATTYLQELFERNQDLIFDAGRAYWQLGLLRLVIDAEFREASEVLQRRRLLLRHLTKRNWRPMQRLREMILA